MLSEEERQEIKAELREYEHKQAASIEALKVVQVHRGWVSDEHLHEVAGMLEMTPDELDAVATFYSMIFRRSVGRHVLLICNSISCWILGYERLLDHLCKRLGIGLGETTADGQFTLLPISCLGACDRGPAMIVDEELYTHLDPAKIDRILEEYGQEPN